MSLTFYVLVCAPLIAVIVLAWCTDRRVAVGSTRSVETRSVETRSAEPRPGVEPVASEADPVERELEPVP